MSIMGYDIKDAIKPIGEGLRALASAHQNLADAELRKAKAFERIANVMEKQA